MQYVGASSTHFFNYKYLTYYLYIVLPSFALFDMHRIAWIQVGTLADFDNVRATYSQLQYEFGIQYNGDVQVAFINGWNLGTRITVYPFYPQGSVLYVSDPVRIFPP
jgi:hypothetical protein